MFNIRRSRRVHEVAIPLHPHKTPYLQQLARLREVPHRHPRRAGSTRHSNPKPALSRRQNVLTHAQVIPTASHPQVRNGSNWRRSVARNKREMYWYRWGCHTGQNMTRAEGVVTFPFVLCCTRAFSAPPCVAGPSCRRSMELGGRWAS